MRKTPLLLPLFPTAALAIGCAITPLPSSGPDVPDGAQDGWSADVQDAGSADVQDAGGADVQDAGSADVQDAGSADVQHPGMESSADAGPTFSVAALPGLALWLDAAKGVEQASGYVYGWADQSGNGNNATGMPASSSGAVPAYVTNDIHGLPGVHFSDSSYLSIDDSPTLRFGTGDFLVAVVVAWTGMGTNCLVYAKAEYDTSPFLGTLIFANFDFSTSVGFETRGVDPDYVEGTTMGLNDGNPRLVWVERTGVTLSVFVAGVVTSATVTPPDDCDAVGYPAYLGAQAEGRQPLTGDIAEVVAVQGTISTANLNALESYFNTKYGL